MPDGKHEQKSPELLYLRNEFLHTLCIADKLGILSSIEHIAKEVHSKDPHAFKMPYVSMPKSFRKMGVTETTSSNCPDPVVLAPQDITLPEVIDQTTGSQRLADVETSVQTATLFATAPDTSSFEETATCNLDHLAPQAKNTPAMTDLTSESENVSDPKSRVQTTILSDTAPDTNSSQESNNSTSMQVKNMPAMIDLTLDSEHIAAGVVESSAKTTVILDAEPGASSSQEITASTFRDEVQEDTSTPHVGHCTANTSDSSYSVPTKGCSQLGEEDMPRRRVKHVQKRSHRDTDKSKRKAGTKHSNDGSHKSTSDAPKTKNILYYGMGAGTFAYPNY